ncbi:hypothetical protein EDD11_007524 [Mortierella claussenii]|nr:hypothetical protein EDD11_007524 [Mortierella claussenii]
MRVALLYSLPLAVGLFTQSLSQSASAAPATNTAATSTSAPAAPTSSPFPAQPPATGGNSPAPAAFSDFTFAEQQHLFIGDGTSGYGGIFDTIVPQFFSLDLSTPWTSSNPAWTKLIRRPETKDSTVGVMTMDANGTAVLFILWTWYTYTIKTAVWEPPSQAPYPVSWVGGFEKGAATDSDTGLVYGLGDAFSDSNSTSANTPTWTMMELDIKNNKYTRKSISGADAPGPQTKKSTVYSTLAKSLFTYEWARNGTDSALFKYNIATKTWSSVKATGDVPVQRNGPCLAPAYHGRKLILAGGATLERNPVTLTDVYIFDVVTSVWSKGAALPKPYTGSACAVSGDSFILWGGYNSLGIMNKNVTDPGATGVVLSTDGPIVYNIVANSWGTSYTPGPAAGDNGDNSKPSSAVTGRTDVQTGAVIIISMVVATAVGMFI